MSADAVEAARRIVRMSEQSPPHPNSERVDAVAVARAYLDLLSREAGAREEERERCAKVCESQANAHYEKDDGVSMEELAAGAACIDCATIIRALPSPPL